jgi:hypothetical protein
VIPTWRWSPAKSGKFCLTAETAEFAEKKRAFDLCGLRVLGGEYLCIDAAPTGGEPGLNSLSGLNENFLDRRYSVPVVPIGGIGMILSIAGRF